MQVYVITRHAPANYGSLLQTIATQKLLEQLGCECKIIDYIPRQETGARIALTQLKGKKQWNKNPLKKIMYLAVREPENLLMYHKFSGMRKQYLQMTGRYHTQSQLQRAFSNSKAIFMTGSDQVWGPVANGTYDAAYFLNFVPENCRKVAFAASFGKTAFDTQVIQEYREYLKKYDAVAVREDVAVELLHSIDIGGKQVLDPTLLISAEEWAKYITRSHRKNYILVYQIHNDPVLNNYARKFAEKAGMPLVRVSPLLHQAKRGGEFIYLPEMGEFLALIKDAAFLITDSFHGTAFAINFNTQFAEVLPNTSTGSRNQSILKLTGLEDRIVADADDFKFLERKIDFEAVNKKIDLEREKSFQILEELLGMGERL